MHLNRFGTGTPPERGRFRCEVPNAAGVDNMSVYVNIGEWFVSSSVATVVILLISVLFYSSGHNSYLLATPSSTDPPMITTLTITVSPITPSPATAGESYSLR